MGGLGGIWGSLGSGIRGGGGLGSGRGDLGETGGSWDLVWVPMEPSLTWWGLMGSGGELMGPGRIQWDWVGSDGTQWDLMGSGRIQWDPVGSSGTWWYSMEPGLTWWGLMGSGGELMGPGGI